MADVTPIADYTKYYVIGGIAVALIGGFVIYKFVIKKPTNSGGAKLGISAPGTDGSGTDSTPATDTSATSGGTGSATVGNPSSGSSSTSQGNDYITGDAIQKAVSGNYAKYDTYDKVADMTGYMKSISDNLGLAVTDKGAGKIIDAISKKRRNKLAKETQDKVNAAEPYVRGFLKGLNLAARQDYVGIFASYIQTYLANPAKLPYTQVTVGQFLTS